MRPESDGDWAARLGIKCEYPDGADRCAGCPHYYNPQRQPECSYAQPDNAVSIPQESVK